MEKAVSKTDALISERNVFVEKIIKTEINAGGEKVAQKMDEINTEMKIRRQVEDEKSWYQSTDYEKINKKEADKKIDVIAEFGEIIKKAELAKNKIIAKNRECKKALDDDINANSNNLNAQRKANEMHVYKANITSTQGFARIAGYSKEKGILDKYFISEIEKEKHGEEANVPNSVLFFGPTGNGKTTFAKAFAAETGCKLEKFRVSDNASAELLLTKLYNVLKKAEENYIENKQRTIIFIDEFEKVVSDETILIDELTKVLNSCSKKYHTTFFTATNHPFIINLPIEGENAVFPYIVSMDPPDLKNKIEVLKYYLNGRGGEKFDYNKLAGLLEQKEQETGRKYNIAQIKDDICLIGDNKIISEKQVADIISKSIPNIDKDALEKYNKEMQVLMTNRVEN